MYITMVVHVCISINAIKASISVYIC